MECGLPFRRLQRGGAAAGEAGAEELFADADAGVAFGGEVVELSGRHQEVR